MRLIMCVRHPVSGEPEAEPVMVDAADGRLILTLDDGEVVSVDSAELWAAASAAELATERAA